MYKRQCLKCPADPPPTTAKNLFILESTVNPLVSYGLFLATTLDRGTPCVAVPVNLTPFTHAVYPERILAAVAVPEVWEARLLAVTLPDPL